MLLICFLIFILVSFILFIITTYQTCDVVTESLRSLPVEILDSCPHIPSDCRLHTLYNLDESHELYSQALFYAQAMRDAIKQADFDAVVWYEARLRFVAELV